MAFIAPLPILPLSYATRSSVCASPRSPLVLPLPLVPLQPACHPQAPRTTPRMDLPGTGIYAPTTTPSSVRVVIFGATGYIGRYVVFEFVRQGYDVIAFARERSGVGGKRGPDDVRADLKGARVVFGDVCNPAHVARAFEVDQNGPTAPVSTVVVSCLASRSGGIDDSNAIDYQATLHTLEQGRKAGASHFVLLSAVCVEKPLLEFQRAKLRVEAALQETARDVEAFSFSIVRPTAFFKSLAGQIQRMKKGAAFVMFGDGDLCRCNALSEADLARFMALCVRDESKRNAVLPVGGPGEPVTPLEQAEMQFRVLGKKPKYVRLPIGLMDGAIGVLDLAAKVVPALKDAAEFGRIGKYYAVEDMVGPAYGEDTLEEFFETAVAEGGLKEQELGGAQIF